MSECRYHSNCGSYCKTPEQIAVNLCEDCLDSEQMDEIVRLRTKAIVEAATELLDVLDAAANVEEPGPDQREWMERLRTALAA
ncbi:hypothetical protein RBU55_01015 [Pseudomonas chlororaphis subsp. aurantiaca]|uniref:hypothetical protein n=1 Tax=Pseudomonas chlororaphis TaxID=587753 RepID=UPI0027DE47E5|nr:hypothetical protein [Pseudomonas chlororaphis]WMJ00165.1 hypothetical protein RBU55_01015 [Pseudomonas chlororaphis subsp. aurantiaca]